MERLPGVYGCITYLLADFCGNCWSTLSYQTHPLHTRAFDPGAFRPPAGDPQAAQTCSIGRQLVAGHRLASGYPNEMHPLSGLTSILQRIMKQNWNILRKKYLLNDYFFDLHKNYSKTPTNYNTVLVQQSALLCQLEKMSFNPSLTLGSVRLRVR